MKLHEFAKKSGVTIVDCGDGWGGKVGYITADHPDVTNCGFESAEAAYTHWFNEAFGVYSASVVKKLLEDCHE